MADMIATANTHMTLQELLLAKFSAAIPEWERQWIRRQRKQALDRRKDWKAADAPRLLQLNLPPCAEARLQKLPRLGRGVVAPVTSLGQNILNGLTTLKALSTPETPPKTRRDLYRNSRWFPEFVEQAYRGELERALRHKRLSRQSEPHRRASDIAEEEVAAAARISPAQVRKLCHQVRKDYGGTPSSPPTSAAELKAHLELGPSFVRSVKKG